MAVNKVETVEIIRDLVTVLVTELTGSSAWVDNSDGTYTLPICRTYWLKAQDVITVNSIDYTVTNVTRDTSVTVTAASDPTVLTFYLDAPSFYHGTIVQTNQELSQAEANVSERSPMAYLFRDLTDDFKDENDILDRESSIRLFFLHDTNFADYTTDLADEETLEPMRSMAYFFVEEVLKSSKLIGKIEDYSIRDYLKFGVENSSGYTDNIFSDDFSGVELTITLPILKKYLCACDDVKPKIQYIDSDLTLQSSNYGTLIVCTPSGACADGTVNVNKSDATLISAETATSGGTTNYNVADSVVNINAVKLADVKATDSLSITVVDSLDASVSVTLSGGNKITVPSLPATPITTTSQVYVTGQTTSYQTGDDGDLELGNGSTFYVLDYNNGFGTTARFTDTAGVDWTGAATGNLIVDWENWDKGNDTVAVWTNVWNGLDTWANQIIWGLVDNEATGLSGWHLANKNEANSCIDSGIAKYPTFFNSNTSDFWTSTTYALTTTNAYYCQTSNRLPVRSKTSTEGGRQLRYYTLTELGL